MRTAKEITMMYWYGDHMSGWGYALGIISIILVWGVLIMAIIAAVRYPGRDRQEGPRRSRPRRHPSRPRLSRYSRNGSRGEIDADEYRQRLDILRQGTHAAAAGARSLTAQSSCACSTVPVRARCVPDRTSNRRW